MDLRIALRRQYCLENGSGDVDYSSVLFSSLKFLFVIRFDHSKVKSLKVYKSCRHVQNANSQIRSKYRGDGILKHYMEDLDITANNWLSLLDILKLCFTRFPFHLKLFICLLCCLSLLPFGSHSALSRFENGKARNISISILSSEE